MTPSAEDLAAVVEDREFRCHFEMIGAPYSAGARGATLPLAVVAACLKGRAALASTEVAR